MTVCPGCGDVVKQPSRGIELTDQCDCCGQDLPTTSIWHKKCANASFKQEQPD